MLKNQKNQKRVFLKILESRGNIISINIRLSVTLKVISFLFFLIMNLWMVAAAIFVFWTGNCMSNLPVLYFSNLTVFIIYCIFFLFQVFYVVLSIRDLA